MHRPLGLYRQHGATAAHQVTTSVELLDGIDFKLGAAHAPPPEGTPQSTTRIGLGGHYQTEQGVGNAAKAHQRAFDSIKCDGAARGLCVVCVRTLGVWGVDVLAIPGKCLETGSSTSNSPRSTSLAVANEVMILVMDWIAKLAFKI